MSAARKVIGLVLFASALSLLWSYSASVFGWIDVGGRKVEHFEAWYRVGLVAPYAALIAWLVGTLVTGCLVFAPPAKLRAPWLALALGAPPVVFVCSNWYFHRGFPIPPG